MRIAGHMYVLKYCTRVETVERTVINPHCLFLYCIQVFTTNLFFTSIQYLSRNETIFTDRLWTTTLEQLSVPYHSAHVTVLRHAMRVSSSAAEVSFVDQPVIHGINFMTVKS